MTIIIKILSVSLVHYLVLAGLMFFIGLFGLLTSKNILKMLISLEIMLNSININFAAFANYTDLINLRGQVFSLFVMAVAAAEIALALGILIALYRNKPTVNILEHRELKD